MIKLKEIFTFGGTGNKEGQFFGPKGIAEDANKNIWIADEFNHRIQKFDKTGSFICSIGTKGSEPGHFHYPTSITIDSQNNIFVSDRWNHRIQKFDANGNFILSFGSYGTQKGQFNEPWGLSINTKNELFVSDNSNHRIQKFSLTGDFISSFGKGGPNKHFYESAFFKTGFIFQKWLRTINKFNTIESCFYRSHYETGLFEYPQSLFIDKEDNLFVADYGNQRILTFNKKNEAISGIGENETISVSLSHPCQFAIQDNLSIILVETENKLLFSDSKSVMVSDFSLPQNQTIAAFFVLQNKELLIGDATDNKIWKFQLLLKDPS